MILSPLADKSGIFCKPEIIGCRPFRICDASTDDLPTAARQFHFFLSIFRAAFRRTKLNGGNGARQAPSTLLAIVVIVGGDGWHNGGGCFGMACREAHRHATRTRHDWQLKRASKGAAFAAFKPDRPRTMRTFAAPFLFRRF